MPNFDPKAIGLESSSLPVTTEEYTGTDRTIALMEELAGGPRGEENVRFRLFVENIVRFVPERDVRSQIAALYHFFRRHYTFIRDPRKVEYVKDPLRMTEEIINYGRAVGDCDDASTWFLAAPRTLGIHTKLVRTSFRKGRNPALTHVLAAAIDQDGHWIIMDPVAHKNTREMLGRITRVK